MATSAKTILTATVLALAAAPAAHAADAEFRVQPTNTTRTEITHVEWVAAGDSAFEVVVERRHGLWWVVEAREGAANLVVAHEDGVWSARWQPNRYSPSGIYRIRVDTLVSDEFAVRPCECIIPGQVRSRWRDGAFRLRVGAEYAPASAGEFRMPADTVRTGRPLVRVLRNGRRIGSVRLRYEDGAFRGTWAGPRGPRRSTVFQLVSLTDGFGNR